MGSQSALRNASGIFQWVRQTLSKSCRCSTRRILRRSYNSFPPNEAVIGTEEERIHSILQNQKPASGEGEKVNQTLRVGRLEVSGILKTRLLGCAIVVNPGVNVHVALGIQSLLKLLEHIAHTRSDKVPCLDDVSVLGSTHRSSEKERKRKKRKKGERKEQSKSQRKPM